MLMEERFYLQDLKHQQRTNQLALIGTWIHNANYKGKIEPKDLGHVSYAKDSSKEMDKAVKKDILLRAQRRQKKLKRIGRLKNG